ncbi:ferric/cupric-chelate reductase [Haplosporangium sp. Z 767]|nr:ferric/cupric-chelate reductase [Haplosporangium sp. Z 11]KAF9194838.1 ferric/cupric-chelate reductase [Haplosporangium sp. Z 767]
MKYQVLSLACIVVVILFLLADFKLTWLSPTTTYDIYYFNKRDFYFVSLFILPAIISHLITIWGHYYRADSIFQENIVNVSTATAKERKRISVWERHDPWLGYTYKYWALVAVSVFLNLIWFVQPLIILIPKFSKFLGMYGAVTANLAFGSGYAAIGSCGMLLLLVLRRSMLQALGFTYADILPLHRWLGVAFIVWTTIHTASYILYYIHFDVFWEQFNFDGTTRGPQNMIALGAYGALLGLGITAIPQVRRSCYLLFITTHRVFTVIMFVGTLMHFPYYMIWYYILPSICLYLADRFVPKFIQSCSIAPDMLCSFNKDADVVTVVLVSKNRLEPLKPYYPGDYVNLEIPEISTIYHPFTIASYWAEDPYSMTIYIRTFQENKTSWTGALARLCGESEEPVMVRTNVDGVFGDRVHDYLSSKVMVIFAAGAAITTFMSLLKAIAAQIEAADKMMNNPVTIKVHLICTFRYESELYAYGDFMQRITHDPRFTSWLHTEIYVSRPDKYTPPAACPSGECTSEFACGRIEEDRSDENESTSLLAKHSRSKYGAVYNGDGSGSGSNNKDDCSTGSSTAACPSSSCSSLTITNTASPDMENETKAEPILFQYKSLPTFSDASSAASATVHAKKDLIATTIILVVPMIVFLLSRAIPWEGTYQDQYRWCRTTKVFDQHMTNHCLWPYAVLPGIVHIAVASAIGYLGLWAARRSNLLQSKSSFVSFTSSSCASKTFPASGVRHAAATGTDIESHAAAAAAVASYRNLVLGLSMLDSASDNSVNSSSGSSNVDISINSCNSMAEMKRSKGRIQFKRGRMQVNHHIQELKAMGIGQECRRSEDLERMEAKQGGVIVFGGGPDAFVDMIEQSCKKARWDVDFHRETWAP